jgi:hypothetical protein
MHVVIVDLVPPKNSALWDWTLPTLFAADDALDLTLLAAL